MIITKVLWTLALELLLSEEDVNQSKKKKKCLLFALTACLDKQETKLFLLTSMTIQKIYLQK